MNKTIATTLAALALGAFANAAGAQTRSTQDDTLRMPYQKEFWTTGHVGLSLGRAYFDGACPAGASCGDDAPAWRAYVGGRFNNTFGAEVSYLKTGNFTRSSGNAEMQAVNFGLLAGIPLGTRSSVFGKLGALWGTSEVGGSSQNGWGPSIGIGAIIGITRGWGLRLDLDRHRFKLPGGNHENVDTLLVGAQYTWDGPTTR